MKSCVGRCLTITLLLLLSELAFAGQAGSHAHLTPQQRHALRLQRRMERTHEAPIADPIFSYYGDATLYSFCPVSGCKDGEQPYQAGVIQDAAGNLYGTTEDGGESNEGTVFKLAPPPTSEGTWTETVLYNFCAVKNCTDGEQPQAGLIKDTAGNLYGTTKDGGVIGSGVVFKLAPPALPGGQWTETLLYSFCLLDGCTDGEYPEAALVQDTAGNLYGTTENGGASDDGMAFKLAPPAVPGGPWTETVLYNFCSETNCVDGESPYGAALLLDTAGNLYGTIDGGVYAEGAVFKLAPPAMSGGKWTETVLYSFCMVGASCTDGEVPYGVALLQDAAGNLHGTTEDGGANGEGVVFKLAPPAILGGQWTETVLYNFCPVTGCADGAEPEAGLIRDLAGNLYGTTEAGGANSYGTVFKLAQSGGVWTETVLYSFCSLGSCADGQYPNVAALVQNAAGNLYGTTDSGGVSNDGVVFEIVGGVHKAITALGQQADYFGEGEADYTVRRPSKGTFYSLDGSGKELTKPWGGSTDIPVIGDYDGDGKTDFAVFRPSDGTWYITYSSTGAEVTKGWGASGDIPVPGDYDGDGKTDFAIWRPSDGTWFIIYSDTGETVTKGWGAKGDIPVPGDYDGDGKTDFAIWRPSDGTWFIIYSSTGATVTKGWGTKGDIPVPGDYDGDGKTDYAIFRPSIGTWFVLQSSDDEEVVKGWGAPGDVPVARDYDGDGKTDFAVWRTSDGTWYVIYSSNGKTVTKPWGVSTDIPMNKP